MFKSENLNISIIFSLWSLLVIALFLHTSGRVDIPLFYFTQQTGNVVLIERGYRGFITVGLRDEVYAIPPGSPFIHPNRVGKMKEYGIFVAHSIEEARRMIDAGGEDIVPRLKLLEKGFYGFNFYSLGDNIFVVPPIKGWSGPTMPVLKRYSEQFVGKNLEDAKKNVKSLSQNIIRSEEN